VFADLDREREVLAPLGVEHCVVRLVSYREGEARRCGILDGDEVADAASVAAAAGVSDDCSSTRAVLTGGERVLEALASRVGEVDSTPVSELALGPPVPDPEKVLCLGLNYRDHAEEVGVKAPPAPIIFAKFANSLIGPGEPIVRPAISDEIDYEAELAVVIGRRCRSVSEAQAMDYVAGGMPFNDVSARDLQMRTSQWTAGKAIDTFAPSGPALVLGTETGDLQSLRIEARVNGDTLQSGTTADMIFSIAETIAFLSQFMTLEPGDIIATGTPAGVGFTREPPVQLRAGDRVEVEVEGLGVLSNPVIDERPPD
jgi:2-keto-4-pentenoate hydratase/2-oxohepta-3-ene-1,7-dioic acid hydratase in catechol pathway